MVLSLLPAGALAEEPVLDEPVQEELVQEQPVQEEPEQKQEQQQEPVQEPKTETCTHSNDPAVCEACASEARVAAVQAQIDALPGDVTAETKEAAQSALSAVDTAKSALRNPENQHGADYSGRAGKLLSGAGRGEYRLYRPEAGQQVAYHQQPQDGG